MATFLLPFFRCRILEVQRCYISSSSTVVEQEDSPHLPGQCCSDVLISKENSTALGTVTCAPIPHAELWYYSQQIRGGGKESTSRYKKMGCFVFTEELLNKVSKEKPTSWNKHWKSFPKLCQDSVCLCPFLSLYSLLSHFLYLSVSLSLSLSLSFSFSFLLSFFWSQPLCFSISVSVSSFPPPLFVLEVEKNEQCGS